MGAAALDTFNCWRTGDPRMMNAALFLEISAEASRHPELATAFAASAQEVRRELANWLAADVAAGGKGLPPEVAKLRAISLQCYFEGLAIRALREPGISQTDLQAAIEQFLHGLYSTVE